LKRIWESKNVFTGIVQAVGRVTENSGGRLRVKTPVAVLRRLALGDSIAVNGCCLTIVQRRGTEFRADLTDETLTLTSLGALRLGDAVNLEPPLRVGDALSGHQVQGHVEGTGKLVELRPDWMTVAIPKPLLPFLVLKGSLAVDGISLTIARLTRAGASFALIPHTYQNTNLAHRRIGQSVNLETDPMARHLGQLLASRQITPSRLTLAELRRQGF
jgi:riboflavin synthase